MGKMKLNIGIGTFVGLAVTLLGVAFLTPPKQVNALSNTTTALKWTKQTSAGGGSWQTVAWSPEQGKFVALANQSSFPFALEARSMSSANGKTWAIATVPNGSSRPAFTSVAWSSQLGLFAGVACSNSVTGTCPVSTNSSSVITSPDGVTWTVRTNADTTAIWRSIAWGDGAGVFVAVADHNGSVMTSADGITWTARTAANTNAWRSVTWSPELNLFVAVAPGAANAVMTSPDGINWTAHTAAESNTWVSVTWSPELGKFAAVSQDGTNRVMTSPDGINWTAFAAASANSWNSVTWSPELGKFAAVSQDGTNRVMTSPDGVTWTGAPAAVDNSWNAITWSPELKTFMAVASGGVASERAMSGSMVTVGTNPATNVAARSATINGEYLDKFAGANVFLRYRLAGSSDPFTDTAPQAVTTEGPMSANISSLTPTTSYEFKAVAQWPSASGTQTLESGLETFTTIQADDDNDGILNIVEDAAPNGGDANNDGTQDSLQAYVGSFVSTVTGKYVSLELDPACQINTAGTNTEVSNTTQDQNFTYPFGMLGFTADCGTPGMTTSVTHYYYSVAGSYTLRKYNPTTNTYFGITNASVSQTTIGGEAVTKASFTVTDGSQLDTDGSSNGVIVDPAGLGILVAAPSTPPTAPNSGIGNLINATVIALAAIFLVALSSLSYRVLQKVKR